MNGARFEATLDSGRVLTPSTSEAPRQMYLRVRDAETDDIVAYLELSMEAMMAALAGLGSQPAVAWLFSAVGGEEAGRE